MDATTTSSIPSEATTPDHISTIGTLRRLGETVVSTLHNRIELLTIELKEEKFWLVGTLMFAAFAVVFGFLSVVAVMVTIAVLTPPAARPWVMLGLCAVCIGALLFSVLGLLKRLKRPAPLTETLNELKKDMECLKA
jgi:uncharacterized membrane protein YqjE